MRALRKPGCVSGNGPMPDQSTSQDAAPGEGNTGEGNTGAGSISAASYLSPKMVALLEAYAAAPAEDIATIRANGLAAKAPLNARAAEGIETETINIKGADGARPCLVVGHGDGAPIVHIHGGGWAAGSPQLHLSLLVGLQKATARKVYAPHPRQAPEHPFPAPLNDTLALIRDLEASFSSGWHLSGDSAGAHLALAALLEAQAEGSPLGPSSVTLIYGCYRKRFDTASHKTFGDGTAGLSTERMAKFWEWFDPNNAARGADLSAADLKDLPPTLLTAAACDVLYDDTLWLFEKMRAARQNCELHVLPGTAHGFLHYPDDLLETKRALGVIASFMAAHGPGGSH